MSRTLKQHSSPQELARRQHWITIGVIILSLLLVGTWLVTLPMRISGLSAADTARSWWGEKPKTTYLDIDALMQKTEDKNAELTETMKKLQEQSASTTPLTTSTINFLKQNIK